MENAAFWPRAFRLPLISVRIPAADYPIRNQKITAIVPLRIAMSPETKAMKVVSRSRSRSGKDWQIMQIAHVATEQNSHPHHGSTGKSEGLIDMTRILPLAGYGNAMPSYSNTKAQASEACAQENTTTLPLLRADS